MSDALFQIKVGDSLPRFEGQCIFAGKPVDLSSTTAVMLSLRKQHNNHITFLFTINHEQRLNSSGDMESWIFYDFSESDTTTLGSGVFEGEIIAQWGSNQETFPNLGFFTFLVTDRVVIIQ